MPEIMIPQAAVEAAAEAISVPAHEYLVEPSDWTPYCICGWKAKEAYDTLAFDRHIAEVVLEAALPLIREALAGQIDQYAEADDTDGGMGPDFYSGLYRAAHIVRGEQS